MTQTSSVSRSLYRALLKLTNRRKDSTDIAFHACPQLIQFDPRFVKYLPRSVPSIPTLDPNIQQVQFQTLSQIREVVRINFRLNPASSEAIDAGFHAYRSIVQALNQLEELEQQHNLHQQSDLLQYRKFRIGDIIEHKDFKFRGVVTGWEIDPLMKVQILSVLWNQNDVLNTSCKLPEETTEDYLQHVCKVIDSLVQPLRGNRYFAIDHELLLQYFYGYSFKLQRFLPKSTLQYSYPLDFTNQDIQETFQNLYESEEYKYESTFYRLLQPIIVSMTRQFESLWKDYFPSHQHLFTSSTSMSITSENALELQLQAQELLVLAPFVQKLQSILDLSNRMMAITLSSYSASKQQQIDYYYQLQNLLLSILELQYQLYHDVIQFLHHKYASRCMNLSNLYTLHIERPETISPFVTTSTISSISTTTSTSTTTTVTPSLWTLRTFSIPLSSALHQTINQHYSQPFPRYQIGDLIYHKKYDYVAMITEIDRKPTILSHLLLRSEESTTEQPYYRLFPDCMAGLPSVAIEERSSHPFFYAPEEHLERIDSQSSLYQSFFQANQSFTEAVLSPNREQVISQVLMNIENSQTPEEKNEYLERWQLILKIRYLRDGLLLPNTQDTSHSSLHTIDRSQLSFPQRTDLFLFELKQLLHYYLLSLPNQLIRQGLLLSSSSSSTPLTTSLLTKITTAASMKQLMYPLLQTANNITTMQRLQRILQMPMSRFPLPIGISPTSFSMSAATILSSNMMMIQQAIVPYQMTSLLLQFAKEQDCHEQWNTLMTALRQHYQEEIEQHRKKEKGELQFDYSDFLQDLQINQLGNQLPEISLYNESQLLFLQQSLEVIIAKQTSSELSALVLLSVVLRMLGKTKEAMQISQKILRIQPYTPMIYSEELLDHDKESKQSP